VWRYSVVLTSTVENSHRGTGLNPKPNGHFATYYCSKRFWAVLELGDILSTAFPDRTALPVQRNSEIFHKTPPAFLLPLRTVYDKAGQASNRGHH